MAITGTWARQGNRWMVALPSDADVRRGHTVLVRTKDGKTTTHKVKEFFSSEGEVSYFVVGPETKSKGKEVEVQKLLDSMLTTTGIEDIEDIDLHARLDLLEHNHGRDPEDL